MTTFQWWTVGFLVFVFFGSIGWGLLLRWLDDRRDDQITIEFLAKQKRETAKIQPITEISEEAVMADLIDEYFAEVETLARGYYNVAISEGVDAAEAWLKKTARRDLSSP
jgi:hypothetical protein